MSNTEVKVLNAESSWWETACEGRTLPCGHSGLAQLVEHLTVNQVVVSSSLTAGANEKRRDISSFFVTNALFPVTNNVIV